MTSSIAPTALDNRDSLWALQYPYSLDGPLSTHAPADQGISTANCYLIRDGESALLVDTGFTVHRDALMVDLSDLTSADGPLSILPLRVGELNSICNVRPLIGRMNGGSLYAANMGDPAASIEFHPGDAPFGTPKKQGDLADLSVSFAKPGAPVVVGQRSLEMITAPLQLLPFNWMYDSASKTLFTSDVFAYRWNQAVSDPWLVTDASDLADDDAVYQHLLHTRYWWIAGARTSHIVEALTQLFTEYQVENIAPGFGRILQGPTVVNAHVSQLIRLLQRAGQDESVGIAAGAWSNHSDMN